MLSAGTRLWPPAIGFASSSPSARASSASSSEPAATYSNATGFTWRLPWTWAQGLLARGFAQELPDAWRRERQLDVVPSDRVGDGVRDADRRAHRVPLADPLGAECRHGRRGREMADAQRRNVGRGRGEVVDERRGHQVARLVVDVALVQRGGDAVGEPAEHLAVGEERVEEQARVVHRDVVEHPHLARLPLDLDGADVDDEAVGGGGGDAIVVVGRVEVRRRPEGDRGEPRLLAGRQPFGVPVGHAGDPAQREALVAGVRADRVDLRSQLQRRRPGRRRRATPENRDE